MCWYLPPLQPSLGRLRSYRIYIRRSRRPGVLFPTPLRRRDVAKLAQAQPFTDQEVRPHDIHRQPLRRMVQDREGQPLFLRHAENQQSGRSGSLKGPHEAGGARHHRDQGDRDERDEGGLRLRRRDSQGSDAEPRHDDDRGPMEEARRAPRSASGNPCRRRQAPPGNRRPARRLSTVPEKGRSA